jgi:MFS family permease
MNSRRWQWATLVSTFAGIMLPQLVVGDHFEQERDPGVAFLPAGFAFAIWGAIYSGFLAFAVHQVLPSQRDNPRYAALRPWMMVTAGLNTLWLLAAISSRSWLWATIPIIVMMLAVAVRQHRALRVTRPPERGVETFLRVPFSLYLGWLTVAVGANISTVLPAYGVDRLILGAVAWALLLIVVGSAIGLAVRFGLNDRVYAGVFVWAFAAMAIGQWESFPPVAIAAALAAAVFFVTIVLPRPPSEHAHRAVQRLFRAQH